MNSPADNQKDQESHKAPYVCPQCEKAGEVYLDEVEGGEATCQNCAAPIDYPSVIAGWDE